MKDDVKDRQDYGEFAWVFWEIYHFLSDVFMFITIILLYHNDMLCLFKVSIIYNDNGILYVSIIPL